MRPLPFAPCSEAQLEQLCEQLYADALAVVKQAALYVLAEEEEEREEPPGGCSLIQTAVGTCRMVLDLAHTKMDRTEVPACAPRTVFLAAPVATGSQQCRSSLLQLPVTAAALHSLGCCSNTCRPWPTHPCSSDGAEPGGVRRCPHH